MTSPYANPMEPTQPPVGGDPMEWWNADPVAGFWAYLRQGGLNALDPVSKFAQAQYQSTHNKFQAAAAEHPDMGFYNYLQANKPEFDFAGQYQNQSPEQRGDFTGRTTQARGRWVTPR